MEGKVLRRFTAEVKDQHGFVIRKGIHFLISKIYDLKSTNGFDTCTIYVDNGSDYGEDFSQHTVLKKTSFRKLY